jgi:hypothetical protein
MYLQKEAEKKDPFKIAQMMSEIRERKRLDRSAIVSVEDVVLKYIPLGSNQEDVITALEKNGMRIKDLRNTGPFSANNKEYDAEFGAYKTVWMLLGSGIPFPCKFGILADFKGKKLSRVNSTISAEVLP